MRRREQHLPAACGEALAILIQWKGKIDKFPFPQYNPVFDS